MKKIMMTLTCGRACSRSTKRTSSFGARLIAAFAAVLCCAMTTTVFTACGSDDDNSNGNDSPTKPKIVGYQVDYSVEFPKEEQQRLYLCGNYYLLCDKIEIGYFDENGQEQKEVVNNGKWSKSVVYKKSFTGNLKLYLTKPTSLDTESLTYEAYTSIIDFGTTEKNIKAIYSDGTKKDPEFSSFVYYVTKGSLTIPKTTLQQYMEERMKTEEEILTIGFTI